MPPQEETPQQTAHVNRKPDSTAWSKSLAIALVVSAALLIAAAGIIVWLLVGHGTPTTVINTPSDDAVSVRQVSWVVPADFPVALYAKNDQTTRDASSVLYYDDGSNCGFTLSVIPVATDKTVQDLVIGQLAAHAAQGVTTTSHSAGDNIKVKDSVSGKEYTFNAVNVDQTVDVPGVAYTRQRNIIAYKQFGNQVASLGYACKDETWAEKKPELARWAQTFTVKTER